MIVWETLIHRLCGKDIVKIFPGCYSMHFPPIKNSQNNKFGISIKSPFTEAKCKWYVFDTGVDFSIIGRMKRKVAGYLNLPIKANKPYCRILYKNN